MITPPPRATRTDTPVPFPTPFRSPAFSVDLLGRALVAAQSADIVPIVILNKTDLQANLPRARERLAKLAQADVRVIELSALAPQALRETLLPILQGQCSLLLGQSGMGKSTMLNALVPEARAHTQEHSQA